MGRSYWFECAKCGYRAKVSGRADRGVHLFVQTILCRDCKQLYDAVVRARLPRENPDAPPSQVVRGQSLLLNSTARSSAPSFEAALNHLAYAPVKRSKWIQFPAQCPVSPVHRVRPWNEPDKCPRCGLFLDKHALPFRLWE
jgi:hypothetical protein